MVVNKCFVGINNIQTNTPPLKLKNKTNKRPENQISPQQTNKTLKNQNKLHKTTVLDGDLYFLQM